MNARFKLGMAEATRLTREGRLTDAFAALRGSLGESDNSAANAGNASVPRGKATPQMPDFKTLAQGWPGKGAALHGALSGLLKQKPASDPVPVPEGAQFLQRTFANEAGSRDYKLYVPSTYRGAPVPLIVMLHGCTQSPDDFALGTQMNLLAEEGPFLVAYPAQAQHANPSRCWNWFNPSEQQRGRGEPSLIAGMTREIMRDYKVEAGRVYVAGLSAGGAAASIMGSAYPDLFAAVGVHSGLACGAAGDVPSAFAAMRSGGSPAGSKARAHAVPTIVFHGSDDKTVHPVNGDHVIDHARGAGKSTTAEAPGFVTRISHGTSPGGMPYRCTIDVDADGTAVLEQWVVEGLGHAWSGGSLDGSYTEPRGPDASREMLRFFLAHEGVAASRKGW